MILTIDLTPAEESRLQELATQAGVEPEVMAAELIGRELFSLASSKREEPEAVPKDCEAAENTEDN